MKKFNTSPISGADELLPTYQAEFSKLKSGIARAFHLHGFNCIDTPTIERTEVLLAKAGGDTEKQIYKVIKTNESADDADQALRFDHTVPLARYTVEHTNDLTFPFKVAQIGNCFRGERAQKGRFREFCQCDVDVIGWQTLPIDYDAEIIATLIDAIKVLPLKSFIIRLSNRKILNGFLAELNLEHQSAEIFNIIDHAEKVPRENTIKAFEDLGIGDENVDLLLKFTDIRGSRNEVITALKEFNFENPLMNEGINELDSVMQSLENRLESAPIEADMVIVRGLDYYTGTVFETITPDYPEIGSICSGGRYENLASNYTDQILPGVGGSIGLTRLFYILREKNLIACTTSAPFDYCLLPLSPNEFPAAENLAKKLRSSGKSVDVNLTAKKLGDRFNYASKIATFAVVIGENEVKSGKFTAKNLVTGESTDL